MRKAVFSVALLGLGIVMSGPAPARSLSVEDVLKREAVGRVLLDGGGNRAVYEKISSPDTHTGQYEPYQNARPLRDARTRIVYSNLDKSAAPTPLFDQQANAGYWLVGPADGARRGDLLGVFRLSDGVVNPGVVNLKTKQARFFDVSAIYGRSAGQSIFHWVSGEEVIVLTKAHPDDADRTLQTAEGPRRQAVAWGRAWRNQMSSQSVLGAGRYAVPRPYPVTRLVKLNVRTGKVTEIGRRGVRTTALSPSGRYLAVFVNAERLPLDARPSPSGRYFRQRIYVYDLRRNREHAVELPGQASWTVFSWSPRSDRLLLFSYPIADSNDAGSLVVYDAVDGRLRGLTRARAADRDYGSAHRERRAPTVVWAGGTVVYQSVEPGAGWKLIDADGRLTPLVDDRSLASAAPVAADEEAIYFLARAKILRVDPTGTVTAIADGVVSRAPRPRPHAPLGPLEDVPFVVEVGGERRLVFLSGAGEVVSSFTLPGGQPQVRAAVASAVITINHDVAFGSRLEYRGRAGTRVLHTYNHHLAGVRPAVGPLKIAHRGMDGEALTSWLYLPPDADMSEPAQYPLIVTPYAGRVYPSDPPGRGYGAGVFDARANAPVSVQLLAARGYAVLRPSIPLTLAPAEPMTTLVPPVMSAMDAAIATGFVDDSRLAVTGHSYGGYTAMSLAVQTGRFSAIIAMAGVSDLIGGYGAFLPFERYRPPMSVPAKVLWSEFGQGRMGGPPWADPERYVRNSPVLHARRISTPVMLIHGDLDFVAMEHAEKMYTALARQNKDVLFVRYWGEEHDILRPKNVRDMWRRVFDFLEDNGVTPGPR